MHQQGGNSRTGSYRAVKALGYQQRLQGATQGAENPGCTMQKSVHCVPASDAALQRAAGGRRAAAAGVVAAAF